MQVKKDVFLSHASEDKNSYVIPLAEELEKRGISYWVDEAEIKWGDRIGGKVAEGLKQSRYVLVVLSDNFLGRGWPEAELSTALNRENSDGQTIVLPLITTDPKKILPSYPLLNDKLYLLWDKGVEFIADRLSDLLRYTEPETSLSEDSTLKSIDEDDSRGEIHLEEIKSSKPQLIGTTVEFSSEDYDYFGKLAPRIFAILTQWVEFEEVTTASGVLTFPSGSFRRNSNNSRFCYLSLSPGIIPLHQILSELGEDYNFIEFKLDTSLDFGSLVRRSRDGVRNLEAISPDRKRMTFALPFGTKLVIKNEEESSLRISAMYPFKASGTPIPYSIVIRYLEEEPPTNELENSVDEATG